MITFDTNILVYATASIADAKVERARDLLARGMGGSSSILLLQILAEFSNVACRQARIPVSKTERRLTPGALYYRYKKPLPAIFLWRSRR